MFPSREQGKGGNVFGNVFGILFKMDDRGNFAMSPIVVGGGIIVINPQLEGEWAGMRLV